jgi:transcriptional regulator with XRE-family HTH domain
MATAKKYISKSGELSYHIRAYNGYDQYGKQREHRTTWKPDPNMSEKAIEKELERQKVLFEEKIKRNMFFDSNTTFMDYSEKWLANAKADLAPKTYERYRSLLQGINIAIGGIKLINLQSQHLQSFYSNLREQGVNEKNSYAVATKLKSVIEYRHISKEKLAQEAKLAASTVRKACHPNEHISIESADAIASALNLPIKKLFSVHYSDNSYSEKTILHYHRLIGTILRQATRDQLIPHNIATRDYMKAPKVTRKEAVFLDDKQTAEVS